MRWRVLMAVALVAGCVAGEARASSLGESQEGGAGAAPAAPQAPANLLLPPHLTGAFPHMLVLGQERGLPTLQDAVRVVPGQVAPPPGPRAVTGQGQRP
jgi:hypothetical protein